MSEKEKYEEQVMDHFFVDIFNRILVLEENWLKENGLPELTIAEAHMIVAIGLRENGAMSEVAEMVSLTNGTVTTMVKKLENKGYVMRCRDQEDKRILRVHLSESGKRAYEIHQKFHKQLSRAALNSVSPKERDVLVTTMEKISEFFTDLK